MWCTASKTEEGKDAENTIESDFKKYYRQLCFYAEKRVGKNASEDIVSEVFSKILEKKEIMKNVKSKYAYLSKIVHNESIQYKKKEEKQRKHINCTNETIELHQPKENNDPFRRLK